MKLFSDNGHQIHIGDTVETFRGEEVTVIGFDPPRHAGSSGHVIVRFNGGDREERRFYPSVINAHYTEPLPEGVTVVGLDDPAELHDSLRKIFGE